MWKKLKAIFTQIGDFMLDFVLSKSGKIVDELGDLTYRIVLKVETKHSDKSGNEKFQIAKDLLIAELGKLAGKYSVSILHAAIEIAVQVMKDRGKEK